MIWKQEGKSQRVVRSEDDEVMRNLNNGTTWHISRDWSSTRIGVTQVCGQDEVEERPLGGTQPKTMEKKW